MRRYAQNLYRAVRAGPEACPDLATAALAALLNHPGALEAFLEAFALWVVDQITGHIFIVSLWVVDQIAGHIFMVLFLAAMAAWFWPRLPSPVRRALLQIRDASVPGRTGLVEGKMPSVGAAKIASNGQRWTLQGCSMRRTHLGVHRRIRVGEQRGVRRITLREAADVLGVSKDALRQRIRRGTLRSDKGEDGRVYVYLDTSVYDVPPDAAEERGHAPDLVDELRDRVRYLERQVEEERDARRRADTLLAQLMQRIPELEAPAETPRDTRGSTETAAEEPERAELRPDAGISQEGVQRPWWRRVFGGG